jgi:hypothetical protein
MSRRVALGGSGAHQCGLAHVGAVRDPVDPAQVYGDEDLARQRSRVDHSARAGPSPAIWRG